MDFLEDLFERRHSSRGGHHSRSNHGHDDDSHGSHGLPWRQYLNRPGAMAALAVAAGVLLLLGVGLLIMLWPWLKQAVAYVNQHGLQGVAEALQSFGTRAWKGSGGG